MARYTGPVCRLCRRCGDKLYLKGDKCFSPKCTVEKRHTPPGQHRSARRRRVSEYSLLLREKQKVRSMYGILERQFWRYFVEAKRRAGLSGENLLQLLETRLDNVVYRLGFANSRSQARQLVQHEHITVNGRKTNIPSYQVKPGNVISWKQGSSKLEQYQTVARDIQSRSIPGWLSLDQETLSGRVLSIPSRSDIESNIDERLIVAYYSR